jgi:uncharacterized membrane protein YkoI
MFSTARKTVATVAALGALALGGSAIAGAAQSGSSSTSSTASATPSAQQGQPPNGGRPGGRHVGANGKTEQALTADTAAKVKAAALKKVPGGTIERVETDVDHGSPYEAHVTKSDGTQLEVLVNKSFEVTAVNQMQHP